MEVIHPVRRQIAVLQGNISEKLEEVQPVGLHRMLRIAFFQFQVRQEVLRHLWELIYDQHKKIDDCKVIENLTIINFMY